MNRKFKLIERFKRIPSDFTYCELKVLLEHLGYKQIKLGKTSGSRRRFIHVSYPMIILHKPHPNDLLKRYQLRQIKQMFIREGML